MNLQISARRLSSIEELQFSAVLSDLDGVVYRGDEAIPGAVERFVYWHERRLPYCFVTNNAEKSPAEFAEKIRRLGIPCPPEQVVTSAEVAIGYAKSKYPLGSRAYVIGSASLKARVEQAGFVLADAGASAVIVALDRQFNYAMMTTALRNILSGAELIGTNPDVIRPIVGGYEPGTGAIIQSIATTARVAPTIFGKPSRAIMDMALERVGVSAPDAIMLGDQLDTDILAAQNAGVRGVLLETGVPAEAENKVRPDYVINGL